MAYAHVLTMGDNSTRKHSARLGGNEMAGNRINNWHEMKSTPGRGHADTVSHVTGKIGRKLANQRRFREISAGTGHRVTSFLTSRDRCSVSGRVRPVGHLGFVSTTNKGNK